ncbi:MAG TPA: hypothetical protein VE998_05550 [Terriglobales bacterium]|nr:hypothetical protein [Terriglobales bacterium]
MFRRLSNRESKPLSDLASHFSLVQCRPALPLEGLRPGVDNVRYDVVLSSRLIDLARSFIGRVLVRHSNMAELAEERVQGSRPPSVLPRNGTGPKPAEPLDFKAALVQLLVAALERAKDEQNPSVDLLARIAVVKMLRHEMGAQFTALVERCRARLAHFDGPHVDAIRRAEARDRFARLQAGKRNLLRRCGEELYQVLRDIERETLARTRRAMFGELPPEPYEILLNRLLFTENGQDDFITAEHYCMMGHYERDTDRPSRMRDVAIDLMRELTGVGDRDTLVAMSCAPENAQEMVAGGVPDLEYPKGEAQQQVLETWCKMLQREDALRLILASYATAPLLAAYGSQLNPQQLKNGLIDRRERYRIQELMAEHGLDAQPFVEAANRVNRAGNAEQVKIAGRFLLDLFRFGRDLKRYEVLNAAAENVNLIRNDRLRELSSVNGTLYEFLLDDERESGEKRVLSHVILKADVRDSTSLTQGLVDRGLNPASFFSLNFYDPITKLLPKYGATKVFIEGDAVILAIFEHAGQPRLAVGRACVLAREILEIVRAYNVRLRETGLPRLELGIGICYEDGAPLYLMDGNNRIMISKALNESDRLSSNSKGARGKLRPPGGSRVHAAKVEGSEELVRYNVDGICLNAAGMKKLQEEIALAETRDTGTMARSASRLFSGVVPLGQGSFREVMVREGRVARLDRATGALLGWSDAPYYEVRTAPAAAESQEAGKLAAVSV